MRNTLICHARAGVTFIFAVCSYSISAAQDLIDTPSVPEIVILKSWSIAALSAASDGKKYEYTGDVGPIIGIVSGVAVLKGMGIGDTAPAIVVFHECDTEKSYSVPQSKLRETVATCPREVTLRNRIRTALLYKYGDVVRTANNSLAVGIDTLAMRNASFEMLSNTADGTPVGEIFSLGGGQDLIGISSGMGAGGT